MTDARTSAPDLTAPGQRDEVLATKVSIPRPRPDRLARSQLLARLNEGMARPLVLVCTPAGFGKTTLLAEWATSANLPVAWLSLDADDNDPARFWRHVVAALDRACAGLGPQLVPLLTGPTPLSGEGVVTALIKRLEGVTEDLVLVLDDHHLIEQTSIHDGLVYLLTHLPPQLRLVISSRSDPPLPLARLRASDQLTELRADDLRFTAEESAAFLREVWKLELSAAAMAALERRTEGWAAGLQLAALSLQGRSDPDAFLDAFAGTHRYVLDYLCEEVLLRQPDGVRRFLGETSILERLSGPLCDAVTGGVDGQAMLEELERANLFLVPLDEERRWWRYHQLFADMLRARLAEAQPDLVPQLHRRAAAWYERHGLVDDGIRHALAAGEELWTARLIEGHFDALLRRAEGVTVDRWVAALPAELVRSRPRLLLAQAVWALMGGRVGEAEPLVAQAEAALAAGGDEPYAPSVGRSASLFANLPASIALVRAEFARRRGDADRIGELARQVLGYLTEADLAPRLQADWDLAVADWFGGRLAQAEQALTGLVAEHRAADHAYLAVRRAYDLGQVQQARGRLHAALATYERALAVTGDAGRSPPAGIAQVGIAEVRYEQGELTAAAEHATEGVRLCRQLTYTLPLRAGLAVLARIRHAQGDASGTLEAMAEAEGVEPSGAVASLLDPVPTLRARLALARGEVADADRWVQVRGLAPDDQPSYPLEREYLVLARVLLAQAEPGRALNLLERLDALADSQGRVRSLIEIRALRSLASQAAGDHQAALTQLAEALALARPEGQVRVFADEGPPMAGLLRSLLGTRRRSRAAAGSSAATEHLYRVIRRFGPAGDQAAEDAPAVTGLIEPLTDREMEVLRLLAAGRRNQDIARELVVTVETVKKHLSHIFAKLGAANRTQAVAHARSLGLIP